jgi:hypothetical protein
MLNTFRDAEPELFGRDNENVGALIDNDTQSSRMCRLIISRNLRNPGKRFYLAGLAHRLPMLELPE